MAMVSTSGGGELDTLGVGKYPVAGVDGQGVVTAVDRNALVEVVRSDVAEVGISDAESRSSWRLMSMLTSSVSLPRTRQWNGKTCP